MKYILIAVALVLLLLGVVVGGWKVAGYPPERLIFGVVAVLGLGLALLTVTARNLVHAALYLVGFFFMVASQYVLLEAEFLAAMQVLVYIGAVAILLMFGIMLTRNIQGDETTGGHWAWKLPAALAGLAVLGLLALGIHLEVGPGTSASWREVRQRPPVAPIDTPPEQATPRDLAINNMSRAVGDEMMTRFVIPFEVAGLLLTAALVGAIALAQGEGEDIEETPRAGARPTFRPDATEGPGGNGNGEPYATQPDALTTPASAP